MNNISIRISSVILLMLMVTKAKAQQEPQYTQNQFNSNLIINPAYAGASTCPSIGLRYRKQWAGFDGAPATFGLIAEKRMFSERLGVGLCFHYDMIGIDRTVTADLNIAYHLPVSENGKLALGFKLGAGFLHSDYTKLTNITPGDPLYGTTQNYTIPALGIGALYYTKKFYIGLTSPRLISFENATAGRTKIAEGHYYAYSGVRLYLDDDFELRPVLLFKYQPKSPLEADLAADLWFKERVAFGAAYRTGDAVMVMLKVKWNKIQVGYSYDINTSGLRYFNNGTHEIGIGFEFCPRQTDDLDRSNNIRYF